MVAALAGEGEFVAGFEVKIAIGSNSIAGLDIHIVFGFDIDAAIEAFQFGIVFQHRVAQGSQAAVAAAEVEVAAVGFEVHGAALYMAVVGMMQPATVNREHAVGFEGVLNGLNRTHNLDIYVTGSNSKFLSSDILTEFRGRGDEVRVYPLSFSEYLSAYDGDKYDAWQDYYTYGGLPLILTRKTDELKETLRKMIIIDPENPEVNQTAKKMELLSGSEE